MKNNFEIKEIKNIFANSFFEIMSMEIICANELQRKLEIYGENSDEFIQEKNIAKCWQSRRVQTEKMMDEFGLKWKDIYNEYAKIKEEKRHELENSKNYNKFFCN